jgi:hypothetical protein
MALTPLDLIKGHLNLNDQAMAALRQAHQPIFH